MGNKISAQRRGRNLVIENLVTFRFNTPHETAQAAFEIRKSETFADAQKIASKYGGNLVPKRSEK